MEKKRFWITAGIPARLISTGERVHIMNIVQGVYKRNGVSQSRVYGVNCRMVERKGEPIARVHTSQLEPLKQDAAE